MLDIRNLNQGIDRRREEIFDEYFEAKYANFRFKGFEDYERLKKSTSHVPIHNRNSHVKI